MKTLTTKPHYCLLLFLSIISISYSQKTDLNIEKKIGNIIKNMTLEQKIGQACLKGTSSRSKGLSEELKNDVRKGLVGAILNLTDPNLVFEIQKIALEESPNHIPLLFGRDVIHGYKTIFPIPLGLAASWDMDLVEKTSKIAANESYSRCINWTYAPMVDIARDARWGRIAESPGEDPLLASRLGVAYVKGFQGNDPAVPGQILACAKHFAAYGAAEGGRDYNTVSMSESLLRNVYLKPFEATAKAGAATFMSSFNDVNGVPASGNPFLLKKILREEWKYDGFVVSDWNSVTEMIPHGFAADEKDAALKSASAGLDMEMTSLSYAHHLKTLIAEKKISEKQLDEMVRNILRIKFRAGIFENPYFKDREKFSLLSADALQTAKTAASKSSVLLKNENQILPLKSNQKIAVIGPLADASREQLGTWIFDGNKEDSQTPLKALQNSFGANNVFYSAGLSHSRSMSEEGFAAAIAEAKKSDVILLFAGEEAILSGEAHSRANINLPGLQEKLIAELQKTEKPIVLVLMSGRPVTLGAVLLKVNALIMAWHPGTMAGPAISDLLLGVVNPSGKLPVTWPKEVGQIPIYYNHPNTGRPADPKTFVAIQDIPIEAWQSSLGNNSHYLDAGYEPQYPFGFGLSYTTFSYENLKIEKAVLKNNNAEKLNVSAVITNTGNTTGIETVQLYVRDITGSIVRPIRELKDFVQIELKPKESKTVQFSIPVSELAFYNDKMELKTEPGDFKVWIASHAENGLEGDFKVE
ncbi:glycoside hydrolase family 3 N-terminal domain-containing protein [Flavobacterium pectinovorum]|uniref:glycoside hydrolase family 3 N-terminal domain-containing protein n=1 Tax=Flavobacterium pectinovorum TaxID=29533 RepID=UPI00265DB7FB|nr:glycoside hydrolase family 3 N-terminal domain-containing protein [Flavobacterium pectinovorum]WKL47991.1 glycoside hydrolase family 3 N-terminal domain-containing protein [Flavobacterium pectinovorum]